MFKVNMTPKFLFDFHMKQTSPMVFLAPLWLEMWLQKNAVKMLITWSNDVISWCFDKNCGTKTKTLITFESQIIAQNAQKFPQTFRNERKLQRNYQITYKQNILRIPLDFGG